MRVYDNKQRLKYVVRYGGDLRTGFFPSTAITLITRGGRSRFIVCGDGGGGSQPGIPGDDLEGYVTKNVDYWRRNVEFDCSKRYENI